MTNISAEECKWRKLAPLWMNYLPPFRPSVNEILFIKGIIGSYPTTNRKALVLGSTPELRDLLSELNISVTVVDMCQDMISEMSKLRAYNSYEEVIVSDWFDYLASNKNKFDFIVSDLTNSNIPHDKQGLFYSLISSALNADGCFIDRIFKITDECYNAEDEFFKFSSLPVVNLERLNIMHFKCFTASDICKIGESIDIMKFFDFLKKDINNPVINLYEFLMNVMIVPRNSVWYDGISWDEIEEKYTKKLKIVKSFNDDTFDLLKIPTILVSNKV